MVPSDEDILRCIERVGKSHVLYGDILKELGIPETPESNDMLEHQLINLVTDGKIDGRIDAVDNTLTVERYAPIPADAERLKEARALVGRWIENCDAVEADLLATIEQIDSRKDVEEMNRLSFNLKQAQTGPESSQPTGGM